MMKQFQFENTINLSNEGKLTFFFLGTGNSFSKQYFQTNLLIIKGDTHLLVDCGSLCSYAMETQFNTKLKNIRNLVVTHPHSDHIGGVEELAFVSHYNLKQPVNMIITDSFKKKLWKESLRGGMQYSENGLMTFDDYFNQIKPRKIAKNLWQTKIGSIDIKLFRTYHVTKKNTFRKSQFSVGLIIDDRILFTGDTQFKLEQLQWINSNYNIEYIFHDCDLPGASVGVHASYEQLKSLPDEYKNKMFLCHYQKLMEEIDCEKDGFAGFAKSGIYYEF